MITVRSSTLALLAAALLPLAAFPQQTPGYHVTKSVPLGLPDRWDYVVYDSNAHRVYVSHGDHVTVVDGRSGEIIAAQLAVQVSSYPIRT